MLMRGDRHIRRVGLKHDCIERQRNCQASQVIRSLEGQHTAKSQVEPHVEIAICLCQAAVECMAESAVEAVSPERVEHGVMCLAHM